MDKQILHVERSKYHWTDKPFYTFGDAEGF